MGEHGASRINSSAQPCPAAAAPEEGEAGPGGYSNNVLSPPPAPFTGNFPSSSPGAKF